MTRLRKNYSIGSVVATALIAMGLYQFGPAAIGGFARHLDNVHAAVGPTVAGQKRAQEDTFKTLCPVYWRDANWIQKRTTNRDFAWCEDYSDRL